MIELLRFIAETLRLLLYIQTALCYYPVLTWFGLAGSKVERNIRTECELFVFPVRLLLRPLTDRHPGTADIPLIIVMSIFYCAAYCLPEV